jgi:hypothetical protein
VARSCFLPLEAMCAESSRTRPPSGVRSSRAAKSLLLRRQAESAAFAPIRVSSSAWGQLSPALIHRREGSGSWTRLGRPFPSGERAWPGLRQPCRMSHSGPATGPQDPYAPTPVSCLASERRVPVPPWQTRAATILAGLRARSPIPESV